MSAGGARHLPSRQKPRREIAGARRAPEQFQPIELQRQFAAADGFGYRFGTGGGIELVEYRGQVKFDRVG